MKFTRLFRAQNAPLAQAGYRQLVSDLDAVFQDPSWFSTNELLHLLGNLHRLIRGSFWDGRNGRCIFGMLTELRPNPIESRSALTEFFTGGSGHPYCELPCYQPARWLVRLWDESIDDGLLARYKHSSVKLDLPILRKALWRGIRARRGHDDARNSSATMMLTSSLMQMG